MSGHTKGPWYWQVSNEEEGYYFLHSQAGEVDGSFSGFMQSADFPTARLIAAAPDLLEALIMVLDDPQALDGRPRTAEVVRKAIAKATGEAP